MHNGVFNELTTVIAFYDKYLNKTRTLNPETNHPWAPAKTPNNINFNDLKKGKKPSNKKNHRPSHLPQNPHRQTL